MLRSLKKNGEHTLKSDVYCFGIVLLELITGRRAVDTTRPADEQNLVAWVSILILPLSVLLFLFKSQSSCEGGPCKQR